MPCERGLRSSTVATTTIKPTSTIEHHSCATTTKHHSCTITIKPTSTMERHSCTNAATIRFSFTTTITATSTNIKIISAD